MRNACKIGLLEHKSEMRSLGRQHGSIVLEIILKIYVLDSSFPE
jgi:hypothetical protein